MRKSIIIGAISSLVAVGGVSAYVVLDKSPKEQYFQAEINQYGAFVDHFTSDYQVDLDYIDRTKNEPFEATRNGRLQLEPSEELTMNSPEVNEIASLVERFALQLESNQHNKKNEAWMNATVLVDENHLLNAEIALNEKELSLRVPDLHPKYFVVQADTFGETVSTFFPDYDGPDTLDIKALFDVENQTKVDEKLLKDIQKDYAKTLLNAIEDDSVTEEKVEYKGEKGKKLTLTLSDDEIKTVLKVWAAQLKEDDRTLDLLTNQLVASEAMNFSDDEWEVLQKTNKEALIESIEEMIDGVDDADFGKGLVSSITVVDKQMVARYLEFNTVTYDEEIIQFVYQNETDGIKGEAMWTVSELDEDGELIYERLKVKDTYTFERNKDGFETVHLFILDEEEKIQFTYTRENNKKAIIDDASFEIVQSTSKDVEKAKLFFKRTTTIDKDTFDTTMNIGVSHPDLGEASVEGTAKTIFTKKPFHPIYTDANSTHLEDFTARDVEALEEELTKNAELFMEKNKKLFEELGSPLMVTDTEATMNEAFDESLD